jgi:hypothetical protein
VTDRAGNCRVAFLTGVWLSNQLLGQKLGQETGPEVKGFAINALGPEMADPIPLMLLRLLTAAFILQWCPGRTRPLLNPFLGRCRLLPPAFDICVSDSMICLNNSVELVLRTVSAGLRRRLHRNHS